MNIIGRNRHGKQGWAYILRCLSHITFELSLHWRCACDFLCGKLYGNLGSKMLKNELKKTQIMNKVYGNCFLLHLHFISYAFTVLPHMGHGIYSWKEI